MNEPSHYLTVQNQLGETPIWEQNEKALYWVDWGGGPICRLEPETGEVTTFPVNIPVTALARRANGGWLAIAHDEIQMWDQATNLFKPFVGPANPGLPTLCYNDCAVDRQGRLLVGTVNMDDPFAPEGTLYRLDPDGSLHELDTGYATVNGIGVSPDGKTLYVTDMRHHQIVVMDYDADEGTVKNRHLFARVPTEQGMPDGLVVDAEGYIWSGHWDGWRLTRYDPQGRIDRQIRFPVQHVISFAFGGPNLDQLFVTTAWWGFNDEERQRQPWAGDLFMVETGVVGLFEPAFDG
jgi:sugar lactone lactonase YvrE